MAENITDVDFFKIAEKTGFELDEGKMAAFHKYYDMLIEKNQYMNLTAITEYNEVLIKHFADSLLVKRALDEIRKDFLNIKALEESRIADIGTGAGFPGIPIKICSPDSEITLIDSLNKRIKFLRDVIEALGLSGVEVLHGRSEDLGHKEEYREKYDLVLSRAVADLSVLSEYCMPFVKTGGCFISYKAENIEEEAKNAENAIKTLGGRLVGIIKKDLPGSDLKRSFCIIIKERKCGNKYPRKAGTPAKEPL